MLRESRGQRRRLLFFTACLAIGVAAVVAVAGLASSLDRSIRGEARQLLAADLVVQGRSPAPPQVQAALAALPEAQPVQVEQTPGPQAPIRQAPVRQARVQELVTIAAAAPRGEVPGPSRLVELKAVSPGYPFYGTLRLDPERPLSELLDASTALAAPELLAALGLAPGDPIKIGSATFRIAGAVVSEPDRLSGTFSLGPRLLVSTDGLARAELTGRGSRVSHRLLVKLPPALARERVREIAAALKEAAGPAFRVETYTEAQPELRRGLARAERFLGLVALLSLSAGGIGVAQTVRAWLAGRMDSIAVLKCLGVRPREVLALYLGQTALLGLAGSAVGALAGIGVMLVVPRLLPEFIPAAAVRPFQPAAVARGLALGTGVALLFSLPTLAAVRRVPPARVLRRDAEPVPPSRWARAVAGLAVAAGLFALAAAQSGSPLLGAGFVAGIAAATGALAGAAWLLTRLASQVRERLGSRPLPVALGHGLAALARPGAATFGALVALGLGVLVVLSMSVVEDRLSARLRADLPAEAPTVFLLGIQPDQWPEVERLLAGQGATRIDSVPVVTARLAAIDGRTAEELLAEGRATGAEAGEGRPDGGRGEQGQAGAEGSGETRRDRAGPGRERRDEGRRDGSRRWALTREQRLTYLETLPADNQIIAGTLWSDPSLPELSIEEEFASDLGLRLGSRLTLDIQGVPLELAVTSLRRVEWETFGINFFLVAEPGALDEAPQQRLAAARLPPGSEQGTQDLLVSRFPNVTLLNVRAILEKVAAVLEKLGLGVRFLGGFTVLSGIAILAGAVAAGAARRGREVALLKTLGMTRLGVACVFSVEYCLVGLAAGLIGAVGGGVLAWAVVTEGMELPWSFDGRFYLAAVAGSALLAVVAGLAASSGALRQRPIEVLRHQE
jgi:putative ABC transport system permease protein